MDDLLRIEYIPLDLAMLWEDNQKKHDLPKLIESFERYGFKDAPKFEPTLNGGRGGIVAGNGRMEALAQMRRDGIPAPRGITEGEDGVWLVPVQFGVDAASELAAKAYGIDHNNITLMGSNIPESFYANLWKEGFIDQLSELQNDLPLSISESLFEILTMADLEMPVLEKDKKAVEDERAFDSVRVKVYDFAQIEEIVNTIRELGLTKGWDIEVELPG